MSAHAAAFDLHDTPEQLDPGNAGTITINRSPGVVGLISAGAETRTLGRPTKAGVLALLYMKTDGGDITLTVTGGVNEDGDTSFTFSDPGQFLFLIGAYESSGGTYYWRKVSDHGLGNIAPADSAVIDEFSAVTATAAELNMAADESANSEVVITTNVIAAAESGTTYYLSLAAGFTSTLPAPAQGMKFRFIVKTAPTGAPYVITTNGGANILYGQMLERAGGAGVAGAAQDTFNFVHNQSIIGDWAEFYSDGTNWYYHGMVDVAAGNTVAVT